MNKGYSDRSTPYFFAFACRKVYNMLGGDDMLQNSKLTTEMQSRLLAVYDDVRSVDRDALQTRYDEVYGTGDVIYVNDGAGRGFVDADGVLHKAAYSIGIGADCIAIMKDKTAVSW